MDNKRLFEKLVTDFDAETARIIYKTKSDVNRARELLDGIAQNLDNLQEDVRKLKREQQNIKIKVKQELCSHTRVKRIHDCGRSDACYVALEQHHCTGGPLNMTVCLDCDKVLD